MIEQRRCDALVGRPDRPVSAMTRCKRAGRVIVPANDGGPSYVICTYHKNHGCSKDRWIDDTDMRVNDPFARRERRQ